MIKKCWWLCLKIRFKTLFPHKLHFIIQPLLRLNAEPIGAHEQIQVWCLVPHLWIISPILVILCTGVITSSLWLLEVCLLLHQIRRSCRESLGSAAIKQTDLCPTTAFSGVTDFSMRASSCPSLSIMSLVICNVLLDLIDCDLWTVELLC